MAVVVPEVVAEGPVAIAVTVALLLSVSIPVAVAVLFPVSVLMAGGARFLLRELKGNTLAVLFSNMDDVDGDDDGIPCSPLFPALSSVFLRTFVSGEDVNDAVSDDKPRSLFT